MESVSLLSNCTADYEQGDFNPFVGYVKEDGSINIRNAILKPALLFTYICGICYLIGGIYRLVRYIFFCKQQIFLKELLQLPKDELGEALLDMGFWFFPTPENPESFMEIQDKETIERVLAHFEKKLPILTGQVVKDTYTTTEKKIMESIRKREKITQKYYKNYTFYYFLGTMLGLGPYWKVEHGCVEWGPKPADLEDRILQWRKETEEEEAQSMEV